MARETLRKVIVENDTIDIKDKYLEVKTNADGFTGTHHGIYSYVVKQENGEYFVYPVETDGKGTLLTKKKSPIIYTEDENIYFVVRTISDPYNHPIVREENIKDLTKEKQVLEAFLAFVESNFTLGVYNVFYTTYDDTFGLQESNSNDADKFEDDNDYSTRDKEERMAWGNTRNELRVHPYGVKDALAKQEQEAKESQEQTDKLKEQAGASENTVGTSETTSDNPTGES